MAETVKDEKEIGKGPKGERRRWVMELTAADKREKNWRKRSAEIETIYRDDEERAGTRMNILWSNTETLRPALFSSSPEPDVRRRFKDNDPIGKQIAMVAERAISFEIDNDTFTDEMSRVVTDYLITGRGVAREQYVPIMAPIQKRVDLLVSDEGDFLDPRDNSQVPAGRKDLNQDDHGPFLMFEDEEKTYEYTQTEHVIWDQIRFGPHKKWKQCPWVAFRHEMTRQDLKDEFPEIDVSKVALEVEAPESEGKDRDEENEDIFKRAEVWEIWDKKEREVVFVSKGYKDGLLDKREDPLKLEGFFPMPEPLVSLKTSRTSVPIPEYTLYQDQANELNKVTSRIDKLVEALKAKGAYDGSLGDQLSTIFDGEENRLIGVDSWRGFAGKGGFQGVIDWVPVEQFAKVLLALYEQRTQLLETIYQITGISDIIRGSSDPRETATAQRLKGQFGSLRLQPRQADVQAFVRGLFRLKAEIISEHFSRETVQAMTGLPVTDEMVQVMQSDGLRAFRIDVETDTTIAGDDIADKEAVVEFLTALGGFANTFGPLIEGGIMPGPLAAKIMLWASRRFKVSREIEDDLETIGQQQAQQGQQPQQGEGDGGKVAAAAMKAKVDLAKTQVQAQQAQAEMEFDREKFTAEQAIEFAKLQLEQAKIVAEQRNADREARIRIAELTAASQAQTPEQ